MDKEEYQDFVLRYKGCGACFPMYHTLNRFEKMWFTAIQKDVAELEKENAELRNNGFTVSAMTEQQLKVALEKGEQLKKENAELKEKYADLEKKYFKNITDCDWCDTYCNSQLIQAKEIIGEFVFLLAHTRTALDTKTVMQKAEQFLREIDIDNAIQKANEGLDLDKVVDEVEQDLNESCPDVLCEDCNKEGCTVRKLGLVPNKE